MTARLAFVVVAGLVLASLLVTVVFRPAYERGGLGELVLIFVVFGVILAAERWMRTR